VDKNKVIADAMARRRKKETLERAIGKAVRRSGGTYEDYIDIMSHIRERREERDLTLEEAAREVAGIDQS
jgi:hypothetical protein